MAAEYESGTTLNFVVDGTSATPCRSLRVIGTEGELDGHFEKGEIAVSRFRQGFRAKMEPQIHTPKPLEGAHSGGDTGVLSNFLRCYRENDRASV